MNPSDPSAPPPSDPPAPDSSASTGHRRRRRYRYRYRKPLITPNLLWRRLIRPILGALIVTGSVGYLLMRSGWLNESLLLDSRDAYLTRLETDLRQQMAPSAVGENPADRRLPADLGNRVGLLLEFGNGKQKTLASMALGLEPEQVEFQLRANSRAALEEAVRAVTLEGHQWYRRSEYKRALKAYERALTLLPEDPQLLAYIALTLTQLKEGDIDAHWRRASALLEEAIRGTPVHAGEWCEFQNHLGMVLMNFPTGEPNQNLLRAISRFNVALHNVNCFRQPALRARLQVNMGLAWLKMSDEDRVTSLQKAVSAFQSALAIYSRRAQPLEWAHAKTLLGNAWLNLAPLSDRPRSEAEALKALRDGVEALDRRRTPLEWAEAQTQLALALEQISGGDAAANREQAVVKLQEAGMVYSERFHAEEWARNRLAQANALRRLAEISERDCNHLWQSMAYLKAASLDSLPTKLRQSLQTEVDASRLDLETVWHAHECGPIQALDNIPAAR